MDPLGRKRSDLAPLGHRPDVQALRGLAVLVVVLYHAQVLLPGGFVGVDVFLVISGFVIGRGLLAQLISTDRVSLRSFYLRRARRLLPALAAMLSLVVLLAPLLAPTGAATVTARTGIAAALFNANTYLYRATAVGYFDAAAELNPLLHTWSLSVEEQFYFVIPALLLLAWKLSRRVRRPVLGFRFFVTVLLVVSFGTCLVFSYSDNIGPLDGLRFAFFSPVTRAWEFAAGLALVALPLNWFAAARARTLAVASGLGLILFCSVAYSDATRFPGAAALVPVAGAVLVIYGGTAPREGSARNGNTKSVLRPMIWLGDLSYSWYLWHWPLIVFAGAFWPRAGVLPLVLAAAASLGPAWLSFRTLERKLRATPTTRTRRTVLLASCCIVAPLVAAALALPIQSVVSKQPEVAVATSAFAAHADRRVAACRMRFSERPDGECIWGDERGPSVVLVGDSNAGHFSEALIGATERTGTNLRIATGGNCPFADTTVIVGGVESTGCREFVLNTMGHLEEHPPGVVVIANATDGYLMSPRFGLVDSSTGERVEGAEKQVVFRAGLERFIARLHEAGSRVVLVNVIPKPKNWEPRECSNLALLMNDGRCWFADFTSTDQQDLISASQLEALAAANARADVWSFNPQICPDRACIAERDGTLVWSDSSHITVATSESLAEYASAYLEATMQRVASP